MKVRVLVVRPAASLLLSASGSTRAGGSIDGAADGDVAPRFTPGGELGDDPGTD